MRHKQYSDTTISNPTSGIQTMVIINERRIAVTIFRYGVFERMINED